MKHLYDELLVGPCGRVKVRISNTHGNTLLMLKIEIEYDICACGDDDCEKVDDVSCFSSLWAFCVCMSRP